MCHVTLGRFRLCEVSLGSGWDRLSYVGSSWFIFHTAVSEGLMDAPVCGPGRTGCPLGYSVVVLGGRGPTGERKAPCGTPRWMGQSGVWVM